MIWWILKSIVTSRPSRSRPPAGALSVVTFAPNASTWAKNTDIARIGRNRRNEIQQAQECPVHRQHIRGKKIPYHGTARSANSSQGSLIGALVVELMP